MAMMACDSEDWQMDKCVLERNKHMFENSLATDVVFVVGREGNDNSGSVENIKAHKYVLISGSPVFWTMFCGELKEASDVTVPDVDPDVFKEMLRYIYYEEINITGDTVMQILYLSKKYLIPKITKLCTTFLEENLSIENVCTIFEQCIMFNESEVINKCKSIIQENTSEILQTEGFAKMSKETLIKILDLDKMYVDEVELFEACLKWAKPDIQIKPVEQMDNHTRDWVREQLGLIFFKIRFTQMNLSDFANIVVPFGILTKEEENMCFRYFTQDNKPDNLLFQTKPRMGRDSRFIWLSPTPLCETPDVEIWAKTGFNLHLTNLTYKIVTIGGFNGILNSNVSSIHFRVTGLGNSQFSPAATWKELTTIKQVEETRQEGDDYIVFTNDNDLKIYPFTRVEFALQIFGKLKIINHKSCKFEKGDISFNAVSDFSYIPITGILCRKEKTNNNT